MIMLRLLLFGAVCSVVPAFADDPPPAEPPPAIEIDAADIQGKPQQDLVKVTTARYYAWYDTNGWHLRTAAKGLTQFNGSLKLQGGSFGKLRTIGLEPKAKNPDRWELNEDRTEIRFQIHTAGSFDGFDFDVRRENDDARIAFDLTQGKDSTRRPRRIFLGRDSKNPEGTHFECPAAPDLVKE